MKLISILQKSQLIQNSRFVHEHSPLSVQLEEVYILKGQDYPTFCVQLVQLIKQSHGTVLQRIDADALDYSPACLRHTMSVLFQLSDFSYDLSLSTLQLVFDGFHAVLTSTTIDYYLRIAYTIEYGSFMLFVHKQQNFPVDLELIKGIAKSANRLVSHLVGDRDRLQADSSPESQKVVLEIDRYLEQILFVQSIAASLLLHDPDFADVFSYRQLKQLKLCRSCSYHSVQCESVFQVVLARFQIEEPKTAEDFAFYRWMLAKGFEGSGEVICEFEQFVDESFFEDQLAGACGQAQLAIARQALQK